MPVITIKNLSKSFGDLLVFRDINLSVEKGECISIIGPSGCGKSTLLRCINRLTEPSSGTIEINGQEITAKDAKLNQIRQSMGMVYQSFNLFSHKSVLENVMLAPMLLNGLSKKEAGVLAINCLQQVGMAEHADSMPDVLSGGQKQRVAIARCLAMKPEIILFDEPTSALDPTMVDEVLMVIRRLVNTGMTCMVVTHEINFARSISSRIVFMEEKGIYEIGTPEQLFTCPEREKTRAFIHHLKTFHWRITGRDFDCFALYDAVEVFLKKQFVSAKQLYHVQLALEETLEQLLLPHCKESTVAIDILIEYDPNEPSTAIQIDYEGEPLTPDSFGEDDLSYSILRGLCKDSRWEANHIRLVL